jgi:hypothetical protein
MGLGIDDPPVTCGTLGESPGIVGIVPRGAGAVIAGELGDAARGALDPEAPPGP